MNISSAIPSAVTIERLMASHVGDVRARSIRTALKWPEGDAQDQVSRGELALAVAGLLFEDVQRRVPLARAYVEDSCQAGHELTFDHGALRTVAANCGELPSGAQAFTRFLEPLGYERAGVYDLEKIGMTGYAYSHRDFAEEIPQYFVSELHPERFSEPFQAAVQRVVGESQDPLSSVALELLKRLAEGGSLGFQEACNLLPELARCFDRQHTEPTLEDYEAILQESAEMAWISTEGNAFNHATDRVEDVFAVADRQRDLGRPIKEAVEVSKNGNVMQTAFRAAVTQRLFRTAAGHRVVRDVPGSFHEFITRKRLDSGALDLTFDAGNATSIFKMTAGQNGSDQGVKQPPPSKDDLCSELRGALGADCVFTEAADMAAYEAGWRYGEGSALVVVKPRTTGAVAAAVKICAKLGARVQPVGANTGLVAASNPDASGEMVVLSLERLSKHIEFHPSDSTVVVDAGVTLSQLNEFLKEHGRTFPIDLGADPQIGGMIVTNTGGSRLVRYGDVRANLLGIEVVLPTGEVFSDLKRLAKNNTGLDAKQVFVGTSGTFGVVTRASLRTWPLPKQTVGALVCATSGDAVVKLLQRIEPAVADFLSAFEAMSKNAVMAVLKHGSLDRSPFPGEPPAYAVLVELQSGLSADTLDLEDVLAEALGGAMEDSPDDFVDVVVGDVQDFWHIRHQVSESLREEGVVLGLDVSTPRGDMADFTREVERRVHGIAPDVRVCDFGHWGDGGSHLNLVWADEGSPEECASMKRELQALVYDICVTEYGGSYSAEHGVGPHNLDAYERFTDPAVRAMARGLKETDERAVRLGTFSL